MEKKKKEQWEKDIIKSWFFCIMEMVAFAGCLMSVFLSQQAVLDETLGLIFSMICVAITLVFFFHVLKIFNCHAVPEKSTLKEGDIKSKNFEELMNNVANKLSDLPRKNYKYEDHLHDPIVLNEGTAYTYIIIQKKSILKIFVFMHVTDFSKFDLKRDLTIIWNRICGEIEYHNDEIIPRVPRESRRLIGKRIVYSVCVDKHTEDFQQYLDDNAGKYNAKGNGAFFMDVDEGYQIVSGGGSYFMTYMNDKLEAGICFETQKRYYLVPGKLNQGPEINMWKWFLEIMKDC